MKNLVILIIGLLICATAIGQTDHLTLYKLPGKNKTKRIKLNKPIKFEIGLQKTDTLKSWKRIEGKLLNVGIDSLTVAFQKEHYNLQNLYRARGGGSNLLRSILLPRKVSACFFFDAFLKSVFASLNLAYSYPHSTTTVS